MSLNPSMDCPSYKNTNLLKDMKMNFFGISFSPIFFPRAKINYLKELISKLIPVNRYAILLWSFDHGAG